MKSIYELNDLLSEIYRRGGYFLDFVTTRNIQAGILRIHAGDNDTQEPHSVDEVYFVVHGSDSININGTSYLIKKGTFIFVAAGMNHRLHSNREDLVIFYALGGINGES